jgi:hypothetical protein
MARAMIAGGPQRLGVAEKTFVAKLKELSGRVFVAHVAVIPGRLRVLCSCSSL